MKISLDYQPFDRVCLKTEVGPCPGIVNETYEANGKILVSGTFFMDDKPHRILRPIGDLSPGHYDDNRWTPYPGDPCFTEFENGEYKQLQVLKVGPDYVEVISTSGITYAQISVYEIRGYYAVLFNWRTHLNPPIGTKLFPGRIKITKQ